MKNSVNEVYPLDIVVLTPLHVGCGTEKDWAKGLDYVQKNGKVYHLSQKKMLEFIDVSTLASTLINKDDVLLMKILAGNLEKVSDRIYEMKSISENDIRTFLKNGLDNRPVLPGSSLKGALRSILFSFLKSESQMKEEEVFGRASNGDEFMRFIKVSDSTFEKTGLINTKIFNLFEVNGSWEGGWKHGSHKTDGNFSETGFNTIYEVLMPGDSSKVTIALANKQFSNFESHNNYALCDKKKEIVLGSTKRLFRIINEHTKNYIEKEIRFYKKFSNHKSNSIIEAFEKILGHIPEDDSWCVLKMSAGSGFHNITGDWQYNDYIDQPGFWNAGRNIGKKKYKSRKIAIDPLTGEFLPMGFVKIGRKSEAELEAERKELVEKLERERIEKEKAEEEEKVREKTIIEEQERLQRIEIERQQREKEERRRREKKEAEIKAMKEAEEKARLEKREKEVNAGLDGFMDDMTDFNYAKKRIDQWMKKAKVNLLPEEQHETLFDALVRFYNDPKNRDKKKWELPFDQSPFSKKIASWIGDDLAREWYSKIVG